MAVETQDVVATPAEAEQLELAPLIISDSLRELPRARAAR